MADKWYVYKTRMANTCSVALSTAAHIGDEHLGPYGSKAKAIKEMCDNIDDTMSDPAHCWVVAPADICSPKTGTTEIEVYEPITDAERNSKLTLDEIRQKVSLNNKSELSDELVITICWMESTFNPSSQAPPPSTSKGLMMMNNDAVDLVNTNIPVIHFTYADMLDADKAIACGTYYLHLLYTKPEWGAKGNKRETLHKYRGKTDYVYADKVIVCEACLQSTVVLDQQTYLDNTNSLS